MTVVTRVGEMLPSSLWITFMYLLASNEVCCSELWQQWWSYDGFSGPSFWGTHLSRWSLCRTGKYQSPINIEPERLIYDPNLTAIKYNTTKINGTLYNTGRDLTFDFNTTSPRTFKFTGGPFSYNYAVYRMKIHFGSVDKIGSEHMIDGQQFPLELQIMGYNEDLYKNYTEATISTHGLAIISILGAIDDEINPEFDRLLSAVKQIDLKGGKQLIDDFSVKDIIPQSEMYITYDGSLTQPSCQETVTWIIVNKPLRITKEQMESLRSLNHYNPNNNKHHNSNRTTLASNNFRPPLPVNNRPVRTNVPPYIESEDCAIKIKKSYKVNRRLISL